MELEKIGLESKSNWEGVRYIASKKYICIYGIKILDPDLGWLVGILLGVDDGTEVGWEDGLCTSKNQ